MAATWAELAVVALPLVRELFLWLRERSHRRSAERLAQEAQPSIGISFAECGGRCGVKAPVDDRTALPARKVSRRATRRHLPQ